MKKSLAHKISEYCFFSLILLIPFIDFIRFNGYGYFQPEILLLGVGVIAIGMVLAWCYHLSNIIIKLLIFAITVTFALSFLPGLQSLLVLLSVFILTLLLAMLLAGELEKIVSLFAMIFLATIILMPEKTVIADAKQWQVSVINNSKLPPIIYLILDEHAGIDSLPTDTAAQQAFKQQIQDFYLRSGFELFTAAYSHYPSTYNSVPNLLNFSLSNKDNSYFTSADNRVLKQNNFFKLLAERGYQFKIYQPDFIDYCQPDGAKVNACYTYSSLSIKNIANVGLSVSQRILFVLKSYLLQSAVFQMAMQQYQYYLRPWLVMKGISAPQWFWYQARVSALTIPETFKQLRTAIVQSPNGTVFFAHLLAPHNPFVYDANCNVIPTINNWQVARGPEPFVNSPVTRLARYTQYEAQIGCVQKQLGMLFATMQQAGIYNKAIIIIHADHGSRISEHNPYSDNKTKLIFNQQDFYDYYNALFAVKIPGVGASENHQLTDLQTLLAHITQNIVGQKINYSAPTAFVYLYPKNVGDRLQQRMVGEFK